jgi:phage regulator Rha-like protein
MTTLVPVERIANKIYVIREKKVMLDRDLAELYGVETKRLKEQVRRNIERFPEDFMFELTKEELKNLRSQFATSSWGGARYSPMAFSEHGVLMLSTVLKSERAVQVNIQIMRTFTKLREALIDNKDLRRELKEFEQVTEERFQIVFETLDKLLQIENKPKKKIGYTVKEKQKVFSNKTTKKKKTSLNGSFTPKAKKIWEAIAGDIRIRLLNNVWCRHCGKMSSIGNLSGKVESGMLVLRGSCTKCGSDVARVIENE